MEHKGVIVETNPLEMDLPNLCQNDDFYKQCDDIGLKKMDPRKKSMLEGMEKEKS